MFGSKCFAIAAAACVASLSMSGVDAGALPSGVCYSPWHHDQVNAETVKNDMNQMKQYFSTVRTFHASFSGVNAIDAAAAAGVKVAVGIMMGDKNGVAAEITAACDGAKRNPGSVAAIYVGNENLQNNGFGSYSAGELVGYINQLKGCTTGLGIKIGSVQRINEWLDAAGAAELAGACDTIGVNIYPFFTPGSQSPIEKLKLQWAQMTAKYAENKIALTETGWPRQGESSFGNSPSKETTESFLKDFAEWSKQHTNSFFFMMYDAKVSYSGQEFEKHFGLANTNGALQVAIPTGDGSSTPATTPAPAPAPGPAPAPVTDAPAPVTNAPAPATDAPAPATVAPMPGNDSPTVTPAPTTGAPGQATDAPAPAATTTPPAASDSDAGKPKPPAPTPAKTKKTHCV